MRRSRTAAGARKIPTKPRWLSVLLAGGVLAGALGGCVLLPAGPPAVPFTALPPASYGGTVRAEQRLTLSYEGAAKTLQCYVEVTPDGLTLVGATALGVRVFSVTWDAGGRRVEGDVRASEQALRDLQLTAWPLATLQQAVAGSEWRIEEPRPGTRQVWRGKQAYAEIHYAGTSPWDGRSWLVNLEHRYTVDLESKVVR